jgi:hypothetical protein
VARSRAATATAASAATATTRSAVAVGAARDLLCHRDHPRGLLDGEQAARAIQPGAGLVLRAELNGPLEDLLGALGVAAAQQDLAEIAVNVAVTRRQAAGGDQHLLGIVEAPRVRVHPRRGGQRAHVELARGMTAHDLHEIHSPRATQGVAERDRLEDVRVPLPARVEVVDRLLHRPA